MVASVPEETKRTSSTEDRGDDRFGPVRFGLGRCAERGAERRLLLERGDDGGVGVADGERSPGEDVIDVAVAVGVEHVGAVAAQ
ncbi:MAG: hypothetical protein U0232_15440 [Thermomicrobiales bacterium]